MQTLDRLRRLVVDTLRSPRARVLTLGGILCLVVIECLAAGMTAGEDAYIVFRYAENILQGMGFRFSSGDAPCEGFSSFLWTNGLALLGGLGIPVPELSQLLGIYFTVLSAAVTYLVGRRLELRRPWLAPLLLATSAHAAYWSTFGLEAPLFVFLLVLSFYAALKFSPSWRFVAAVSVPLALMLITRPEGVAAGAAVIFAGWLHARQPLRSPATRWFLTVFGIFLLLFAAFSLYRLAVFDSFYSSPAMVKLFGRHRTVLDRSGQGVRYLFAFFLSNPFVALSIPVMFLMLFVGRARAHRLTPLLAMILAAVAIVILEGGDATHFFHWRLLLPLLPFVYLGLAVCVDIAHDRLGPRWSMALALWTAVLFSFYLPRLYSSRHYDTYTMDRFRTVTASLLFGDASDRRTLKFKLENRTTPLARQEGLEPFIGHWMKKNVPAGSLLATGQAGQIPYYSGLSIIDLVGLVSCEISHCSSWQQRVRVTRGRNPDLFLLSDTDFKWFGKYMEKGRHEISHVFRFKRKVSHFGEHRYYLFSRKGLMPCADRRRPERFKIGTFSGSLGRGCVHEFWYTM